MAIEVCGLDDLSEGLGRAFEIQGKPIAVFRTRTGKIFAVDSVCPHKGGPLADGMLAGSRVVCPYHGMRFQAETGECDRPDACSIQVHPIEVINNRVYLVA